MRRPSFFKNFFFTIISGMVAAFLGTLVVSLLPNDTIVSKLMLGGSTTFTALFGFLNAFPYLAFIYFPVVHFILKNKYTLFTFVIAALVISITNGLMMYLPFAYLHNENSQYSLSTLRINIFLIYSISGISAGITHYLLILKNYKN